MKRSLIPQARGWCLTNTDNKNTCRRWAFQRLYRCSDDYEELNNDDLSNNAEKETPEPSKKKRASLLNRGLSMLEANILKALEEIEFSRVKEMTELRAEVAKLRGPDLELVENMQRLREKLTELVDFDCRSKDLWNSEVQVAVEETREKVEGLESLPEQVTWLIDHVEKYPSLDTLMSELQMENERVVGKMEELQEEARMISLKAGASCGNMEKYSATKEDLLQGVQEELQGLRAGLLSRETEDLAHRVSVDCRLLEVKELLHEKVDNIEKKLDGLSEVSVRLRLLTREVQDMEKYPATKEDMLQGVQEELQGLRVVLALRENKELAHRVSLDNQQMDSSKRIWEEMRHLRDGVEAIKKFDQNRVQLATHAKEPTSGKDHANVVLVSLSSAFLACSTVLCAWTLQIW